MIYCRSMPHREVKEYEKENKSACDGSGSNTPVGRCHMYAIIATGGKQYKVAEGDVIRVEKLGVEAGETVTFDQVLAVSNDGLKVGEDVKNASVTASVVGNGKGKKVIVYKYKRKTGYHKKNGHRQQYTEVKIEKINA